MTTIDTWKGVPKRGTRKKWLRLRDVDNEERQKGDSVLESLHTSLIEPTVIKGRK